MAKPAASNPTQPMRAEEYAMLRMIASVVAVGGLAQFAQRALMLGDQAAAAEAQAANQPQPAPAEAPKGGE